MSHPIQCAWQGSSATNAWLWIILKMCFKQSRGHRVMVVGRRLMSRTNPCLACTLLEVLELIWLLCQKIKGIC
jgi:hypothetical protein